MASSLPAADLMDRIYRHQRHFYDATRKHYLLGRDQLIAQLGAGSSERVLEIGCGTGRNLIEAARRYPDARYFGIDISTEMLATAKHNIARAKLGDRISVARGDAAVFDPAGLFGEAQFERIFMSYCLSMIPDWQSALDAAMARLAPGGQLHIVDFGGQTELPRWFRAGLRGWLSQFHVTPRDDLEPILLTRAQRTGASVRVERPFRDYAQYAVFRRPAAQTSQPK
jgi:S-adenosylmethionine-diacylgycerolhomoserine-N-methlytransferase